MLSWLILFSLVPAAQADPFIATRSERPILTSEFGFKLPSLTGVSVMLAHKNRIAPEQGPLASFTGKPISFKVGYGEAGLCADDPYFRRQKYGFCSGCLVGPDLVLTARHCADELDACESTAVVFDFKNPRAPKENIYSCAKRIVLENLNFADIAMFKIDRPRSVAPVKFDTAGSIGVGDQIAVIGHPWGTLQSIAIGNVTDRAESVMAVGKPQVPKDLAILADAPSYTGNSGSCVFNTRTQELVGVLSTGAPEVEYDSSANCFRTIPASKMKSGDPYSVMVPVAAFIEDLSREIKISEEGRSQK